MAEKKTERGNKRKTSFSHSFFLFLVLGQVDLIASALLVACTTALQPQCTPHTRDQTRRETEPDRYHSLYCIILCIYMLGNLYNTIRINLLKIAISFAEVYVTHTHTRAHSGTKAAQNEYIITICLRTTSCSHCTLRWQLPVLYAGCQQLMYRLNCLYVAVLDCLSPSLTVSFSSLLCFLLFSYSQHDFTFCLAFFIRFIKARSLSLARFSYLKMIWQFFMMPIMMLPLPPSPRSLPTQIQLLIGLSS